MIIAITIFTIIIVLMRVNAIKQKRDYKQRISVLREIDRFHYEVNNCTIYNDLRNISKEVDDYYSSLNMTSLRKTKLFGYEFMMLQMEISKQKEFIKIQNYIRWVA